MEDDRRPPGQPIPIPWFPDTPPEDEGRLAVPNPSYVPHALEHELPGGDAVRLSVQNSGTQLNRHRTLNFGTGLTATEDSDNKRITVTNNNPTAVTVKAIWAAPLTGNGSGYTASTTAYVSLGSAVAADGTESARETIIPFAGTLKNLYVRTFTAQPASGSLVITIRKNGADTVVVVTIAAGAAAGTFSDTSNTVTFAAGDRIAIKVANNATALSAIAIGMTLEYDAS